MITPFPELKSDIELFHFQQICVNKLYDKAGALVGDDMGLGKTVEGIALDIRRRNEEGRLGAKTLVIAPLSVLSVWASHYARMAPRLKVEVIDPKDRNAFLEAKAHVYIIHWNALRFMPELNKHEWFHVIADEAHRAKNRKAQQTQALKRIRTRYKTALSGTPADDKPHDLWSILNWLYPKKFTSFWRFYNNYVDWDVHPKGGYKIIVGVKNVIQLHDEIRPFYIRRQKSEVWKELPDKTYSEVSVDLLPRQHKAYDQMRKDMLAWVGEHENEPLAAPTVIARLMRLQQFAIADCSIISGWKQRRLTDLDFKRIWDCIWQPQVNPDGKAPFRNMTWVFKTWVKMVEPSSKLDVVMQLLEDNPHESFVVFSQFKQVANLLAERCKAEAITCGLYTGDTSKEDRDNIVAGFQDGRIRVFAGTIRAGGEGITLTRSSNVVFVDRDWSPAKNRQAEDRLHRVGQKNAVQVIDIVAKKTIDRGRLQQIEKKWDHIKRLLGEA